VQDLLNRITQALASRYRIERELGAGGMGPQITRKQTDKR
jgi:hypothetical protein